MTCDKIIESICNIVIAVSAAAAAIGAWRGINSWKKESRWKIRQEIVHKLLIDIYKLRDATEIFRNKRIYPKEIPVNCDANESIFQFTKYIYDNRLKHVDDAIPSLKANLIEAEVRLDRKIVDEIIKLFNLISRLKRSIDSYLERALYDDENIIDDEDMIIKADVIASDDKNEFTELFNKSIQNIETLLKSYLK